MKEPILRKEDVVAWEIWKKTCLLHAKGRPFARRVEQAKSVVKSFSLLAKNAVVSWSMGKDSTAMAHLVCEEMGKSKRCVWRKDDLCFPGEQEYADKWGGKWDINLDVVIPPRTKREVFTEAGMTDPGEKKLKGRREMDSFKGQMAAYWREQDHPGYYVGLRAEEAKGRRLNRKFRGEIYKKGGLDWVCQPLVDWTGKDVFAYLFLYSIDPFHVYRCCGYREPTWIRLGGFLPDAPFTAQGEIAWLKRYYPSVYQELLTFMPGACRYV